MSIMFVSIVTANSMDNKVDGCTLEQSRYAVNHFRGFVVGEVLLSDSIFALVTATSRAPLFQKFELHL